MHNVGKLLEAYFTSALAQSSEESKLKHVLEKAHLILACSDPLIFYPGIRRTPYGDWH
jgi:hypothetical protein